MYSRNNYDAIFATLLFGFVVYVHFPGFLTLDSKQQFASAISGVYTGHHPPIMSRLWRILNHLSFGPQNLLIVHNLMFFGGLLLLCRYAFQNPWAQISIMAAITFFPSLFVQLGMIWKDTALASSLLLFLALSLNSNGKIWVSLLALLVGVYAVGSRHNGFIAAAPLFVLWSAGLTLTPKKQILMGAVAFLFVFGLSHWANTPTPGHEPALIQYMQLHDLAGISVQKQKIVTPALGDNFAQLKRLYNPAKEYTLRLQLDLTDTLTSEGRTSLRQTWMSEIIHSPSLYLRHRWWVFKSLMGIGQKKMAFPFADYISDNRWDFEVQNPNTKNFVYGFIHPFKNGILFRGWIYTSLIVLFFLISITKYRSRPLLCLSTSGTLYALSYFFIAPAADFRYLYWVVICVAAWLVLFFKRRPQLNWLFPGWPS